MPVRHVVIEINCTIQSKSDWFFGIQLNARHSFVHRSKAILINDQINPNRLTNSEKINPNGIIQRKWVVLLVDCGFCDVSLVI